MQIVALFRHQLDAVGGEQLIVAERGRDRVRARTRTLKSGLHVVGAVAARRLGSVDPDRQFPGQAGRRGDFRISALVFDLALRPLRHELVLHECSAQKIGDDRDACFLREWLLFGWRRRIDRLFRSGIDRRLGQHVVVEQDFRFAAALAVAQDALVGDRLPIRARLGLVAIMRLGVGLELLAVLDHCRGQRLCGRGAMGGRRGARRNARRTAAVPRAPGRYCGAKGSRIVAP